MEALTSSCSKALVDAFGSSSPRVAATAIRFSDKLQLCFSQNGKKVGNFGFLQMVHHKGIFPVHAASSETQVDQETEELQAEQTGDDSAEETKLVRVKFQLQKGCLYGEEFLMVGDDPTIGAWDPSNAVPMTWSEGHVWFVELDVPVGMSIQFKYILKGLDGEITWQPGSDRVVQTWETVNRITVCEDWDNAEMQKIIEAVEAEEEEEEVEEEEEEEEEADQSNEKPQIDSEMSNSSEKLDHPEEEMVSNAAEAQAETGLEQMIIESPSSSVEEPMAIVAENISSPDEATKTKTRRRGMNNVVLESENGNVASVTNQGNNAVKGNNLLDFEEGPVLVPGLNQLEMQPEESQETAKAEVEERTAMDTSDGESEDNDQNLPENNLSENVQSSEEQESNDETPQEITETLSDEPEQNDSEHKEKSHLVTAVDKISDSQIVDENVLQNDIKWGHGIIEKFLFQIGLL